MNSRVVGDVGQAQAVLWFTENDYIVAVPITESAPYDLIVQKRGTNQLIRVQCKRGEGTTPSGIPKIHLRTCGGNQSWNHVAKRISTEEVDQVWLSHGKSAWLVPVVNVAGTASAALGKTREQYKVI